MTKQCQATKKSKGGIDNNLQIWTLRNYGRAKTLERFLYSRLGSDKTNNDN